MMFSSSGLFSINNIIIAAIIISSLTLISSMLLITFLVSGGSGKQALKNGEGYPEKFSASILSISFLVPLALIISAGLIFKIFPAREEFIQWALTVLLYHTASSAVTSIKTSKNSFLNNLFKAAGNSFDKILVSISFLLIQPLQVFLFTTVKAGTDVLSYPAFFLIALSIVTVNIILCAAPAFTIFLVGMGAGIIKGASVEEKNNRYKLMVKKLAEINNENYSGLININGTPILRDEETKSFFILGKPGTGKTLCLFNILECVRKRGKKTIIYDFKGDFISKFYDEQRDLLFNPLDRRSIRWNIFNEITGSELEQRIVIENIAGAIIPDIENIAGAGNEKYFRNGAREVFVAILNYLRLEGKTTNNDIYAMLNFNSGLLYEKFSKFEICSRAGNFLLPEGSPQSSGILSTLTEFTKIFNYMNDRVSDKFSIREWLEDDSDGRTVFLQNKADMEEVLRPVLSLFISILSKKIQALKDNRDNRIYLLLDEAGSLNPIRDLPMLLINGRSKGSSVFMAVQDFSQLDNLYGDHTRKSIVNACTTHIYFSVADSTTAENISRLIGDQEVVEHSTTFAAFSSVPGINFKRERKPAVMASEIMQLKPFQFIFRSNISSPFYGELNPYDFERYPDKTEHFMIR